MRKTLHTAPYRALLRELVAARNAAGLTQQQVADRLKKPQSFMAKVEKGERRLDLVEFLAVTAVLGADPIKIVKAVIRAEDF